MGSAAWHLSPQAGNMEPLEAHPWVHSMATVRLEHGFAEWERHVDRRVSKVWKALASPKYSPPPSALDTGNKGRGSMDVEARALEFQFLDSL